MRSRLSLTLAAALLLPVWPSPMSPSSPARPGMWTTAGTVIPVIATKTTKMYRLGPNGQKSLTSQTEAVFLRDSHGSEYSRQVPVRGLPPMIANVATLNDAATGKTYLLNYVRKTAMVTGNFSRPPADVFGASLARSGQSLGAKMIAGVECEGWAVPAASGEGRRLEMWVAPSLEYLIVETRTVEYGGETDTVLDKIEVGKQPDPSYFQIPPDFHITGIQ